MNPLSWGILKSLALEQGLDSIGWTNDFALTQADYYKKWIEEGQQGTMSWLERNMELRLNPQLTFEGTRTALVATVNYAHQDLPAEQSRYSFGQDYHIWFKEKLNKFVNTLKTIYPDLKARVFVDTSPFCERDLAVKSGLGWIGKNTCLINEDMGSFLFLGVVLVNKEMDVPCERVQDLCASCQICIDSCPTQALTDYKMNATRCLAYHNIEKSGERDEQLWTHLGDHLLGCDICQQVCPWNQKIPLTAQDEWKRGFSDFQILNYRDYLKLTEETYKRRYKESAISRVRYIDFMRNVFLVMAKKNMIELEKDLLEWKALNPHITIKELDYCLRELNAKR